MVDSIYYNNLIFELSANNPTGTHLQYVNEFLQSRDYTGFPIVETTEGIANKYIVPNVPASIPILSLYKHPTSAAGVTILFGFRTPSVVNEGNNLVNFLFDFAKADYSSYYFFRSNAKKIAVRNATAELISPQIDYNFQPDTDYHLTYQYKNSNTLLYINGVLVGSNNTLNVSSLPTDDTLRLFYNPRYTDARQYNSRFYYMYVFDHAIATTTNPPNQYFLTPGFKEKPATIRLESVPIVSEIIEHKIITTTEKVFTYVLEGQVTFNSVVKYKHPSTTFIQLMDSIGQAVLNTTVTAKDGKFKIYTDKLPSNSQLLAVDVSGEYNTQVLKMKL